jgi:hypothetical protein
MGTQSGNRPLAGTMIAPFNTAGLNVRFTPKSGHWDSAARCPLSAISGCEQVHQIAPIQSTSSLYQFSEDYDCER